MSRICERCLRKPMRSQSRSHSNIATKRRQMLNLQWRRIGGKRVQICANCLKTARKSKV